MLRGKVLGATAPPNNLELLGFGSTSTFGSNSGFLTLSLPGIQIGDLVVAGGAVSRNSTSALYPSIHLSNGATFVKSLDFSSRADIWNSAGNYNFTLDVRYAFVTSACDSVVLPIPSFDSNCALTFQIIRGAESVTNAGASAVGSTNVVPDRNFSGIGDPNRQIAYGVGFSNSNNALSSRYLNSPFGFTNFTNSYTNTETQRPSICAAITDPSNVSTAANFYADPVSNLSTASAGSASLYIRSS
jgi:hypothetical protein